MHHFRNVKPSLHPVCLSRDPVPLEKQAAQQWSNQGPKGFPVMGRHGNRSRDRQSRKALDFPSAPAPDVARPETRGFQSAHTARRPPDRLDIAPGVCAGNRGGHEAPPGPAGSNYPQKPAQLSGFSRWPGKPKGSAFISRTPDAQSNCNRRPETQIVPPFPTGGPAAA